MGVSGKQHQRGQTGGTDGVTLGDGFGGVADGIQRVGDGAHALIHFGHFGDTTGVVGDGAVGIDGDDHTGHGEHGHGRHGDAVKTAEVVARNGQTDGQNRRGGGLHGDGQTGDDVGAVAGGGRFGNGFNRAVDTGVVFGDDNDHNGQDQADQGAVVNVHGGDVGMSAHELHRLQA
jgi:hypothetical protein